MTLTPISERIPRRVLCTRRGLLTLLEHLIPLLFLKGVRGVQVFLLFVLILSFGLFQICLVSFNYVILFSRMGIYTGLTEPHFSTPHSLKVKWSETYCKQEADLTPRLTIHTKILSQIYRLINDKLQVSLSEKYVILCL